MSANNIDIHSILQMENKEEEREALKKIRLSENTFLLSPPKELINSQEAEQLLSRERFAAEDEILNMDLKKLCSDISIEGLYERIQKSRSKVFLQFLNQENGCRFNGRKVGMYRLGPKASDIILYMTDYFTHRTMKEVCKELYKEDPAYMLKADLLRDPKGAILFTSIGIDLLLFDNDGNTLLTERSLNAAETYGRKQCSISVIEGIDLSDLSEDGLYISAINAVYRGLWEELGIDASYLSSNSLRFYDLYLNRANLENGLTCSIQLKEGFSIKDMLKLKGIDEDLEVAKKIIVPYEDLSGFIKTQDMKEQAEYTIRKILQAGIRRE